MAGLGETVAALVANSRLSQTNSASGGGEWLGEIGAFGANPGALHMLLHVPERLSAKAALVVVLHGCTQTAAAYAEGAGWRTLADRYGFVLLCPEQTRSNNANLCFNWFQTGDVTRGAGEAASIRAMIGRALTEHHLDSGRVFITGLSAGGAMANAMLAAYPETFAGGAIIAGLPYGAAANMGEAFAAMQGGRRRSAQAWGDAVREASDHLGPWPRVSIWQGDGDTTVSPVVAEDLAAQWADVHGVRSAQAESPSPTGYRRTTWRSAAGEAVVELHRFARMGHGAPLSCAQPEGCGTAGPFLLEVGVSSSLQAARSWGLTEADAERRPAGETAPTPRRRPAAVLQASPSAADDRPRAPGSGLEQRTGKIISDALRSAGLMK